MHSGERRRSKGFNHRRERIKGHRDAVYRPRRLTGLTRAQTINAFDKFRPRETNDGEAHGQHVVYIFTRPRTSVKGVTRPKAQRGCILTTGRIRKADTSHVKWALAVKLQIMPFQRVCPCSTQAIKEEIGDPSGKWRGGWGAQAVGRSAPALRFPIPRDLQAKGPWPAAWQSGELLTCGPSGFGWLRSSQRARTRFTWSVT